MTPRMPLSRPFRFSAGPAALLAGLCMAQTAWADATPTTQVLSSSQQGKASSSPRKLPPHSPDWGVFNAGKGAAAGFGTVGGFGQARWAEDWSDIVNTPPEKRKSDWFNRLKHISLTDKGDIWLSINGEERLRYIFENQPMMGAAGKTNASRVLLRNMYGADLHIGEHVRAYAEFLWGVAGGSNYYGYQAGTQRERLDRSTDTNAVNGYQ